MAIRCLNHGAGIGDGQAYLAAIAAKLGVPTPELLEKRSYWHRAWVIRSLLVPVGAWGGAGRVVISSGLLGESTETLQYLLAHELGHVVRGHSHRVGLAVAGLVGSLTGFLVAQFVVRSVWMAGVLFLVALGAYARVLWVMRGFVMEFEANEVAVRAVGLQVVVAGIRAMSKYEGGVMSVQRTALVSALERKFGGGDGCS